MFLRMEDLLRTSIHGHRLYLRLTPLRVSLLEHIPLQSRIATDVRVFLTQQFHNLLTYYIAKLSRKRFPATVK